MSQGIKPYSKIIDFEVPNAGKILINTSKEYNNVHIFIPLFNSNYSDGINLNLIISLKDIEAQRNNVNQEMFELKEFGYGTRLNFYKKPTILLEDYCYYVITDENDFSSNLYNRTEDSTDLEGSFNNITGTDYFKYNANDHHIEYVDSNGDIYRYETSTPGSWNSGLRYKYPNIIHSKVGDYDKYMIESDFSDKYIKSITSTSGEKALFTFNSTTKLIEKIEILRPISDTEDVLFEEILLEYDNKVLSKVTHRMNDKDSNSFYEFSTSYDYNPNSSFIVKDDNSNYNIKLGLSTNNDIHSIKDGFGNNYNGNINYAFRYYNLKTIITDENMLINENGDFRKIEHHFIKLDGYYFPHFDYDHLGIVRAYSYLSDKKLITLDSGIILVYGCDIDCDKNIIPGGNLQLEDESFMVNGTYASINYLNDETFDRDTPFNYLYIGEYEQYVMKEVNYNGTKNDRLVFSLWGKCEHDEEYGSETVNVSLKFYKNNTLIKTEIIEFNNETNEWIFKCREITVDDSYDKVIFRIDAEEHEHNWYFGAISLLDKPHSTYKYNEDASLNNSYQNGQMLGYEYLNPNTVSTKYTERSFDNFKYDDKNRLIERTDSYGITNIIEYNDKNKVKKTKNYSDNYTKYIKTEFAYNQNSSNKLNNEVVTSSIDSNSNMLTFDTDLFTRLTKKITNQKQETIEYGYNGFNQINLYKVYNSINSSEINYGYYDNHLLNYLLAQNNNKYLYNYDNEGKIKKIEIINILNDLSKEVINYEYQNEGNGESGVHTGNIVKTIYGENGTKFIYSYDVYNRLEQVEVEENNLKTLESTYEYNFLGNLIKYNNIKENYNIVYKYDNNTNLCEVVDSRGNNAEYIYDNKNNLILKKNILDNKTFIESYSNLDRTYKRPSSHLYKNIRHISSCDNLNDITKEIYFNFFDCENNSFSYDYGNIYSPKHKQKQLLSGSNLQVNNISMSRYNKYNYINLNAYNDRIVFMNNIVDNGSINGSAMFWFRPNVSNNGKVLFSLGDNDYTKSFNISIYNNKLKFSLVSNLGESNIFFSTNTININEWNFFSISWEKLITSLISTNYYELCVNGIITKNSAGDMHSLNFDSSSTKYVIGGEFSNGSINQTNKFIGDISCIIVPNGFSLNDKKVLEYYEYTKVIFDTIQNDDSSSVITTNKYNVSNYLTNSNLDIIPLNDNLNSLNGKRPYISTPRELSNYDNDPFFEFNTDINRFAYSSYESMLAYDYGLNNNATLYCKVFFKEINDNSYIFENVDKSNNIISLYVNSSKKVYILFNGTYINTNIEVSLNTWIDVSLSWKSTPYDKQYKRNIDLKVNENTYSTELYDDANFNNFITYVGTNLVSEDIKTLNGQIERLLISNNYINNTINTIINTINTNTSIYKYNDLGLLLSKEVSTDEKIHFKHLYDYKNIEDSENTESQRIGTIINKEEIVLNNKTIVFTYEYDSSGLLKRIYENDVLSKVYEYNYKNELITENDYTNKKANEYMISSNGNIDFIYKTDYETISNTKVYSFEYNNQYSKDILTKVTKDGIINSVTYNDSYFANPTSINLGGTNLILEWTGPKLTKAHLNNNEYVEYKYDALGNRIEKNVISTILESIERKYFYENGKLIREKYIDNRKGDEVYKYFDYDANGLLLSITINNTKYYYIRDIFNTIIGLIDVNGNLIVRYHYDAYGNIIKIDGNSNLAYLNPFIYKGYYYDEETNLFLVSSRYYSPELCRWISPDDIEYLDPESVNGLNLYCYCFNDPINYIDPDGHAPKWLQGLAIGLAVVGAVLVVGAVTVLTCGVGTLAGTMAGAVIYGAAQGIAIGAAVGVVGGGIVGGIASDWSAEGILIGMGIGLGAGAIVGGVIGGFAGASGFTANSAYISQYGGNVKEVLSAYKGNPRLKVLNSNTTAYRTWGGTSGKFGHWISPKNYGSAARSMLSLPPGNTAANTSQFLISKGSTVLSGKAAALFGQTGGGIQWWIGLL